MRVFRSIQLVAVSLLVAGVPLRAELRLVGHAGGRTVLVTGVEHNRIVAQDANRKIELAKGTTYELEGDLRAEASKVGWSPGYGVGQSVETKKRLDPRVYAVGWVGIRHMTEIDGRKIPSQFESVWPEAAAKGGLLVLGWLVDGRISQLAVRKVPPVRTTKFFVIYQEFSLTPAEVGGQGILLLWADGRFVAPVSRFADTRANEVLAALLLGDLAPLRTTLAGGLDPNTRGRNGETLLHFAAEAGATEAVELLLQRRAWTNPATAKGSTPLQGAAAKGRLAVVRLLADKGRLDEADWAGRTALHLAVENGHRAVARWLVEKHASVTVANEKLQSPFSIAVDQGYADLAALMLDHGADRGRYFSTEQSQRILITQARKGNAAMVRFLIDHHVDPTSEHNGQLALATAAQAGDPEMVAVLLKGGARVNATTWQGRTALMAACRAGKVEFARTLLAAGADVTRRAGDGRTCLHDAVLSDAPELVDLLLAQGADPNERDLDLFSPLDLALMAGARTAAVALTAHGAAIDLKAARVGGLMEAALKLNVAGLVRAALADGWSAETKVRGEWTALAVARACQADDCAALLEAAGAKSAPAGVPPLVSAREIDALPHVLAAELSRDPRDIDAYFPAARVELEIVIDDQGRALFPVAVAAPSPSLAEAATHAVTQWRFSPVKRGGQPACARLRIPLDFPASADLHITAFQAEVLPVPLERVPPQYPPQLQSTGQIGKVNVAFTVAQNGRVRDVRVTSSSNPNFEPPAVAAVSTWIFEPGRFDGLPADVRMEQEIVFKLK